MPASSQNSDLKKTNKHIINSSTQLCQLRLGGKQLSHRRKSANDTQNIPSTGEKLDGELQTAGSVLGKRNAERPYLHWNHKVVRAVPEKTSPRSSALRGPSSTSSRLIPSSPLLSSSSSARLYSCWISLLTSTSTQSQPPKLFGGIIHGKGGERRDRKDPGRQPCTLEVAHARQKIYKQARKFHHLLLFKIYI